MEPGSANLGRPAPTASSGTPITITERAHTCPIENPPQRLDGMVGAAGQRTESRLSMSGTRGFCPMDSRPLTRLAAALLATALGPVSVHAEPCAAYIDRVQTQADARIDATAGRGRMGTESTAATDHREPTPESIARAEQCLDGATAGPTALAALAQAWQAVRRATRRPVRGLWTPPAGHSGSDAGAFRSLLPCEASATSARRGDPGGVPVAF
jgi:hypothetical protein